MNNILFSVLLFAGMWAALPSIGAEYQILATASHPEDIRPFCMEDGSTALVTGTKDRCSGYLEVYQPGKGSDRFVRQFSAPVKAFSPVGIAVVAESQAAGLEGRQLFYVVNVEPVSRVSVFERRSGVFHLLGHIQPPADTPLPLINGIAAMPDGAVFVSSFRALPCGEKIQYKHALLTKDKASRPRDALYSFRPVPGKSWCTGEWCLESHGWGGANGLGYSAAQQSLVLATFHTSKVHLLPYDRKNRSLKMEAKPASISLGSHPDNIIALEEDAWMACTTSSTPGILFTALLGPLARPVPLYRGEAVEFSLSRKSVSRRHRLPSGFKFASTAWRSGDSIYAARFLRSGVARFTLSPP